MDAFCLAALLGVLVQEELLDERVPGRARARRRGAVRRARARAGRRVLPPRRARRRTSCARSHAAWRGASSVSILEDLGIQQAPHSTLNSYLEKLLFLLTGNFGKPGGMNLHTGIAKLGGDFSRDTETPVSGERIIIGLVPGNVIPDEILTDDPKRLRAMIVESSNPAHSLADSQRMRAALEQLDLRRRVRHRDDRDRAARRLRAALTVAVREVGGELLLPRVPVERLPAAPPDPAGAAPACCREDEIHSRLVRAAGRTGRHRPRRPARRGRAQPRPSSRRCCSASWPSSRSCAACCP